MKRLIKKFRIALIIVVTAAGSVLLYSYTDDYFEVSKNLDIFSTLFREVNLYYVDSTDPGKLMKKGIDAMLESLDPYTNFIPESEIEDYRFMTTGQYGGIGALIKQKNDYVVISDPYEGYPAAKSGLLAGDVILEIDSKSAKGKSTDDVSHALKGAPKTSVKLLIQRDGIKDPVEKIITREEIKVKSVPWSGMLHDGIGYIKLNSFTENAGREIGSALKALKADTTLKGVILDLRGNPGGLLNEAVNISNVFIRQGQEIVSTRGKMRDMDKSYKALNSPVDGEIPLAVLVNSGSASASEIVSGSLQDLDRGVIIGQRTFGKGLVQTTRPLSYNSQVKITTAKYYIPSGRCIQALDYTHRNEDGSVGKLPDSLLTPFKTKSGRMIYDGGGIKPDIQLEASKYSTITVSLLTKNLIFDYATRYRQTHPEIPAATKFKLTDSDFSDFISFIADKEYDYSTKSEKSLAELKKNAEDENYFASLKTEYEALSAKLAHDKRADLEKNKVEILQVLEEEICSRYYYLQGRIAAGLSHDPEVDKAVEVLLDPSYYAGILNGSVKTDTRAAGKN